MKTFKPWIALTALAASLACALPVQANPVIYTLRTVTDGQLGSHSFSQAVVVIRMVGDTANVQQQPGSNGGLLYTNPLGTATVSITETGGKTTVAHFAPGEVYVRYDAGAGIAGFGSAISPTYPVALGCDNYAYPSDTAYSSDCSQADWGPNPPADFGIDFEFDGTANAQASVADAFWPSSRFSTGTLGLPTTLTQSTLLTGRVHACATTYVVGNDNAGDGDLQNCSGPAPRGLRTDHGGFFLQDQVGGTTTNGPFGWAGWYTAPSGGLQVEVLTHPIDE